MKGYCYLTLIMLWMVVNTSVHANGINRQQAGLATTIEDCVNQAEKFGHDNFINPDCFGIALKFTNDQSMDQTDKITIYGVRNLLFTKKIESDGSLRQSIIAGPHTSLNNIIAVSYDEKRNRVVVINETSEGQREILVFVIGFSGDLPPEKKIQHESLISSNSIALHPNRDEIYVNSLEGKKIMIFSLNSDSRSPVASRKPIILSETQSGQLFDRPSMIRVFENKLFVLDTVKKSLTVFEGSISGKPQHVIDLQNVNEPSAIIVQKKTKELEIYNVKGEGIVYDIP